MKKDNILKVASFALLLASPASAFAASCYRDFQSGGKLGDLLNYVTCTIQSSVIPLIFGLALVSFLWGVVQYVINSDEEAKKEQGRQFMLWGIIGLAVMSAVWGLVAVLGNTLGIRINGLPQVRPPSQSQSSTSPYYSDPGNDPNLTH